MLSIKYLYAKFFKKIIRGKALKNCDIDATSVIYSGCELSNCSIGKYSYCSYDCKIINCSIGNFVSIAPQVIIGSEEHPMSWVSMSPVFEDVLNSGPTRRFAKFGITPSKQTIIGSDVWIGYGAIIKAGVKIGHGAVVGAGAIVTKDVAPYSIVAGSPAKVIKYRFDDKTVSQLLATQWWNLKDSEIEKIAPLIKDVQLFINALNVNTNDR